jgi:hydrogenase/urease accessory protein HupE
MAKRRLRYPTLFSKLFAALLCAVCLLLTGPHGSVAHTGGTTGLATIVVSGQTVQYNLQLPETSITPQLAASMRLGEPGVAPDYAPLLQTVASKIHIHADGQACEAAPGTITPSAQPGASSTIVLNFACAQAPKDLAIRDDLFDALGSDYHAIANIIWSGGSRQFVFEPGARETRIALASGEASRGIGSFFLLGIEHILTGYDHLLFLLALILRGGNLWSLLKIITAFTIAHSITLALAALNIVMLPERFVEATIALSIAYVAAENLFMRKAVSHRWAVSFLFGLVHGFGFSNVLRELGLPKEGLLWSLLNFNLGVEAGQAMAVLAVVPLLVWLRRFKWEPRAVVAMSVLTLAIGLTLFLERALLTS